MYCHIISVDSGDTYQEVDNLFNDKGSEAVVDYLAQWDYGHEMEHDDNLVEELPKNVYESWYGYESGGDDYVLVVGATGIWYSLYRVM